MSRDRTIITSNNTIPTGNIHNPTKDNIEESIEARIYKDLTIWSSQNILENPLTIPLGEMTLDIRENMNFEKRIGYISNSYNLIRGLTIQGPEEIDIKSLQGDFDFIQYRLIQKLPPNEQREHIQNYNLMTDDRSLVILKHDLPNFEHYLERLPAWAKIVDIGPGKECVALKEIKQTMGNKHFKCYAVDRNISPDHDFNEGLPINLLPKNCDFIYSNRTLQYVEKPLQVVQDIRDHLSAWWRAVLHMWYHFSWTTGLLEQLKKLNPKGNLKIIDLPTNSWTSICIVLKKQSSARKIFLPPMESLLTNEVLTNNGQEIIWSNLLYHRKLPEEEYRMSITPSS